MTEMRLVIQLPTLIEAIRKRRVLYDAKTPCNAVLKKKNWEDVAKEVSDDHYMNMTEEEQDLFIKEVQVKWKTLRDNFTRALRREREDELMGTKRRRYVYFEQMSFLAPYCHKLQRNPSSIIYVDESHSHSVVEVAMPEPKSMVYEEESSSVPSILDNPLSKDGSATLTHILQKLVDVQKEDKNDDVMGNKKFLLSLLPFLRKLPDDVNLEVRLQLLSVLQSYTKGNL